jgi:hypothetical protein
MLINCFPFFDPHCQFFPCFHAVVWSQQRTCMLPVCQSWFAKFLRRKEAVISFRIHQPLTKVFLKYWWWQLLPSLSFLRKTKFGVPHLVLCKLVVSEFYQSILKARQQGL